MHLLQFVIGPSLADFLAPLDKGHEDDGRGEDAEGHGHGQGDDEVELALGFTDVNVSVFSLKILRKSAIKVEIILLF